jgi:hypothetical protein
MQPLPPSPALTRILASSMNITVRSPQSAAGRESKTAVFTVYQPAELADLRRRGPFQNGKKRKKFQKLA